MMYVFTNLKLTLSGQVISLSESLPRISEEHEPCFGVFVRLKPLTPVCSDRWFGFPWVSGDACLTFGDIWISG